MNLFVGARRLLPVAAVAVVAAACSGAPSGPAPSAPSGAVAVEASEYKFTPSTLSVPAGDVHFWVHNAGTVEHEFEILKDGQTVDEVEGLVPGLAKELTVPLAPGEYTFQCALSGHDQLGMKGTLTVTGG